MNFQPDDGTSSNNVSDGVSHAVHAVNPRTQGLTAPHAMRPGIQCFGAPPPNPPYSAPSYPAMYFTDNMQAHQQASYYQWAAWQQWFQYRQMTQAGGHEHPVFAPQANSHPYAPQPAVQHPPESSNIRAQYGCPKPKKRMKSRPDSKSRPFAPNAYNEQYPDKVQAMEGQRQSEHGNDSLLHRRRDSPDYGVDQACRAPDTISRSPARRVPDRNAKEAGEKPMNIKQKQKQEKTMLPPPKPFTHYMLQATFEPQVIVPPSQKLVILDLNGTLLHRPNRKQPTKMIGRPFLAEFLNYLFSNFAVMVWSSAEPQNVKVLVETALGPLQNLLVARWARDTLGLAPEHYKLNVQCYKNLEKVWASEDVQRMMEGFEHGKRFDQRNTILIDDSQLKAAAQPFNLLEIPEFVGESTKHDVLGEVAGYLEILKMQEDVSKFIFRTPFKADSTWVFDWEHQTPALGTKAGNGELEPVVMGA